MTDKPGLYARATTVIASTLMLAIVAVMLAQIFYRYVLSDAIIWAEEFTRYCLIWLSFLFVGAAFARGELVAVEMLTARLSPRGRALCVIPSYLMCIAFLAALVFYGWRFANTVGNQTVPAADFIWTALSGSQEPLGITIFWIYVVVPIGCAILLAHFVHALVLELRKLKQGV
jgi:TRAP-type C4-dicarboxylate transport system permease small subunit